jgi:hypothetical protein
MSITLPQIPPAPNPDSTSEAWDRYLRIVALHRSAEASDAIDRQTAQMSLMTAAAQNHAALMQQLLNQPAQSSTGFSETFVMGLLRLVLDKPDGPAE